MRLTNAIQPRSLRRCQRPESGIWANSDGRLAFLPLATHLSAMTATPKLPETPYFGLPWRPLALGVALLPLSGLFIATMWAIVSGSAPLGLDRTVLAIYVLPTALAPFFALDILFLLRAWRIFWLILRGQPAHAEIISLTDDTNSVGGRTGRSVVHARLSPPNGDPFEIRARLKTDAQTLAASIPAEGLPVLFDAARPRRVLVEPSVPGARY